MMNGQTGSHFIVGIEALRALLQNKPKLLNFQLSVLTKTTKE